MDKLDLPKTVALPFGYRIKVIILPTEADILREAGVDAYAAWDDDTRTIYLAADRPKAKQRADLAHELQHAIVDWTNWVSQNLAVENVG